MAELELRINLRGLGEIIKGERLAVPRYQRSYAWKRANVDELYDDLATAIDTDEPEYFLGSVVLAKSERGGFEVVDGQQRLATTIILAAAIRDHLLSVHEEQRAERVANDYLALTDRRTLELQPHLFLNEVDHPFFEEKVLKKPAERSANVQAARDSHTRITHAVELAKERVRAVVKSSGSNAVQRLLDWTDYIDTRAKVIEVKVRDDANAFTIFETLNDRGLELAISDLLKNFLFSRADDRIAEVQASWLAMQSTLESVAEEEVIVVFIRHLWSYQYGLTREKDLYKRIKERIRNKSHAITFATELGEQARTYAGLLNSNSKIWREFQPSVRTHIAAINVMRVEQVRPLLLAVISRFQNGEIVKALRLIVSCVVRVLVAGLRGGTFENLYAELAKGIHDGKIKGEIDLRNEVVKRFPNDATFRLEFEKASVSKAYLARYYLREIEQYENSELVEWVPSESEDDVSLEHVLPKTLSDDWDTFDEESHRTYRYRLGNQAILSAEENSLIGDNSFEKKRSAFAESTFETTRAIAQAPVWDVAAIDARQKQLAQLAVKVWPLTGEIRRRRVVAKRVATRRATTKKK